MASVTSRRALIAFAFLALLAITLVSCEDSTGPQFGWVWLSVQTTGSEIDELFEVASDTTRLNVYPNAKVIVKFPAGQRSFELKGVAENCVVDGSSTASVNVAPDDTVQLFFKVGCAATGILVQAITTGGDIPAFFQVVVPSLPTASIPTNGTYSYSRIPVGRYQVKLRTNAPHCSVVNDSTASADVVNRQVTSVIFSVQCVPSPRTGAIAYGENSRILVMNADGSDAGDLVHGWNPSWSRDGTKIVYSAVECDYYTYLCTGSLGIVNPITRQTTSLTNAVGIYPDWSPTDDVIAYNDANTYELYLYNVATSTKTLVTVGPGIIAYHPSWSPDGAQLVAQCTEITTNSSQLCIFNRDGSGLRYLTNDRTTWHGVPNWSPDGSQIVFSTYVSQQIINVIKPDGTGLRTLMAGFDPSWSPDSKEVIFSGANGLWVAREDGSGARRLTTGSHYSPVWRP